MAMLHREHSFINIVFCLSLAYARLLLSYEIQLFNACSYLSRVSATFMPTELLDEFMSNIQRQLTRRGMMAEYFAVDIECFEKFSHV